MPWALDTEIREPLCEFTSRRDKAVLNVMVYSNLEEQTLTMCYQYFYSNIITVFTQVFFTVTFICNISCMVVFTFNFSTFCKLHKTLNASFLLLFWVMLLSHVIISWILSNVILWVFLTIATFICYNTIQNVSCYCKLGVSYYFPIIKVIFCWITAWLHNWNYTTHYQTHPQIPKST